MDGKYISIDFCKMVTIKHLSSQLNENLYKVYIAEGLL